MLVPVRRRFHPEVVIVGGQQLQVAHIVLVSIQIVFVEKPVPELVHLTGCRVVQSFLVQDSVAYFLGDEIINSVSVLPTIRDNVGRQPEGLSG